MPRSGKRILVYSHDSFGLGHLRRCQTIANSLASAIPDASVLILTGSSIVGSFEFHPRVDFMRLPGILKRAGGEYVSTHLDLSIEETASLRAAMIRTAADEFDPDLFLVDKEPLGVRGEVEPTLELLKRRGVPSILGLRDVMDDHKALAAEWRRKRAIGALASYYNEIWVYGPRHFYDPLEGLDLPDEVRRKMVFTGYLRRMAQPSHRASMPRLPFGEHGYILVTAGGGGDGAELFDWVLRAYEYADDIAYPAYIVFGPFLDAEKQRGFYERAARLERVAATDFEAGLEQLEKGAVGVVAMGGYNTFCEILSLDKRALIVPRSRPRMEQTIRATRAQELGLAQMLVDDGRREPRRMAEALRRLPGQAKPSSVMIPGLLDGIERLTIRAARRLERGRKTVVVPFAAQRA